MRVFEPHAITLYVAADSGVRGAGGHVRVHERHDDLARVDAPVVPAFLALFYIRIIVIKILKRSNCCLKDKGFVGHVENLIVKNVASFSSSNVRYHS